MTIYLNGQWAKISVLDRVSFSAMLQLGGAFTRQAATQETEIQQSDFPRLLETLIPREKEVMELVVKGRHNREIAEMLGISARTVEVHKSRMMAKLQVTCVPDLVRMSLIGFNKPRLE